MTPPILHNRQSWLLLLTGTYCVISVMMNYLCMKPLSFGTSFVWMDGGLLISWIVFLISNVIVEAYGKRTAIFVTGIAALLTLIISFLGLLEVYLPTMPQYTDQATHFAFIFSNGPRTILASAIAFFIGNWVNVSVIASLKAQQTASARNFWVRAVLSTIVGQIADNSLFQVLAFAPIGISRYEMLWTDIWTAVGMSSLFETIVEAFFVPLITIPLTTYITHLTNHDNI
ncbi:MAG: queuosine precursor transporter [Bacteroidales bacterium]|nr:queuosine precursor transporter [Candidatus Colicola caccequi]